MQLLSLGDGDEQQQQQQHAAMDFYEEDERSHRAGWNLQASQAALRSSNPIRRIMEGFKSPAAAAAAAAAAAGKSPISLALGDPSGFGDLSAPQIAIDALLDASASIDNNRYAPSCGTPESRAAVARYASRDLPFAVSPEEVFITPGCSQAIHFCIAALARPGRCCNLLLPRPGFPLYETFCNFYGIEVRRYDLLPEQEWRVDLASLESRCDADTAAIIVCNPGNPCGSVYSQAHLKQIAKSARKLRIPIISDEIYAHICFGDRQFVSMGAFAKDVPVLIVGGISKRWLAPGWRLGWICVCDPHGIFKQAKILEAFTNLAHMHLATSTPIQAALPTILQCTPPKFFSQTLKALKNAAELCCRRVEQTPGLSCPSKPQGSMYIMVKIEFSRFDSIDSDVEFAKLLTEEECLTILPGSAFGYPGWMRLLFAAPSQVLEEAWNRIHAFCKRHATCVKGKPQLDRCSDEVSEDS